jgi:hypothetical protein
MLAASPVPLGNVLFDPHPMQDYANVARQADLDSLSHIVEGAAVDVFGPGAATERQLAMNRPKPRHSDHLGDARAQKLRRTSTEPALSEPVPLSVSFRQRSKHNFLASLRGMPIRRAIILI